MFRKVLLAIIEDKNLDILIFGWAEKAGSILFN
jgi:hypothetical protein